MYMSKCLCRHTYYWGLMKRTGRSISLPSLSRFETPELLFALMAWSDSVLAYRQVTRVVLARFEKVVASAFQLRRAYPFLDRRQCR